MHSESELRRIMTKANALYVGLQEGTLARWYVLFRDATLNASTLALPVEQVTVEAVKAKLAESRERFAKDA